MTAFEGFLITGLVTGCIYALIAMGLVVTYTTTGIFNFSHGAIAMFAAYMFWQLWQGWDLNVILSFLLVLLVIAPLFGLLIEVLLMRPLRGASVDLMLVITLGLLLALVGIANSAWSPTVTRVLPQLYNGDGFRVGKVLVSWHELITVGALVAVAIVLRMLFTRARVGVAMRAVVDNPDLVAMAGGRPIRVQQLSWALSCSLAALGGMLLAPIQQLNILNLTLLVVDGYAAAIIGRLRNLPVSVAGAIVIAVGQQMAQGYLPNSGFLTRVQNIIPMIVLFIVLIALPQDRLKSATFADAVAPRVASLRASVSTGTVLVVAALITAGFLSGPNLKIGANGFVTGIELLSLVLLTGYGGMTSLCVLSFVGLGAFAMSHVGGSGGSLLGVLAAIGLAGGVGALVALPTLRLRGLYLALATFSFATVMDLAVFTQILGTGGNLAVARVHIPGIPTQSDRAYFTVCAVAFVLVAIGVLALRRGSFGRRLVATNDSPAACATLGVNVNGTKLITFTIAAGLAGFAGALAGGVPGSVSANDFAALGSLVVLLLARIGGINTATGALLGASTLTVFSVAQPHLPGWVGQLQYTLTGLAAISVGRSPNGFGGRIASLIERVRPRSDELPEELTSVNDDGTVGSVFFAEEKELAHAGH
ncbi:MAG TPA: ABC transporter permease [Mycobacteriales bacterium]|jgi:branched-chain amino acid transport system permease protein|nr:ABC transporter permease [Mycobacteriales bacterium]